MPQRILAPTPLIGIVCRYIRIHAEGHGQLFDLLPVLESMLGRILARGCDYEIIDGSPRYDDFYAAGKFRGYSALVLLPGPEEAQKGNALKEVCAKVPCLFLRAQPDFPIQHYIGSDDSAGAQRLVEHLVSLGHKRLGFFNHLYGSYIEDRYQGFLQGLKAHGLSPAWVHGMDRKGRPVLRWDYAADSFGESLSPSLVQVFDRMLAEKNRPEALCFPLYQGAVLFLRYAHSRGLQIPRDMAVTSFDNPSLLVQKTRDVDGLTTMVQNHRLMGELAGERACDLAEGRRIPAERRHLLLPCQLLERRSTRNRLRLDDDLLRQQLIQILQDECGEEHLHKRLSQRMGLTPRYFLRKFQELTGAPFRETLSRIRLDRAKALIEQTRRPITQVAVECGFRNYQTFFTAFRRRFGKSPLSLRRVS